MGKDRKLMELGGDLRVRNLPDIRLKLMSIEAVDLDVDLGGITEFDTAGLQLLLSLRKELSSREGSLIISKASEPVLRLLTFFGAQDLLARQEVENG